MDTVNPNIDSPSDDSYEEGTTGNQIVWTGTDLLPDNYIVYKNGSGHSSGSWVSGVGIVINIDGFSYGFYNFTIIIFDTSGNNITDEVVIQIVDTTSPDITHPSDFEYNVGQTDNYISWIGVDENPEKYMIFRNETSYENGSWTSGVPININVDGLTEGIYNFTCYLNDTFELNITDMVLVTVTNLTSDSWAFFLANPEEFILGFIVFIFFGCLIAYVFFVGVKRFRS